MVEITVAITFDEVKCTGGNDLSYTGIYFKNKYFQKIFSHLEVINRWTKLH